jgi:hypothetical protein
MSDRKLIVAGSALLLLVALAGVLGLSGGLQGCPTVQIIRNAPSIDGRWLAEIQSRCAAEGYENYRAILRRADEPADHGVDLFASSIFQQSFFLWEGTTLTVATPEGQALPPIVSGHANVTIRHRPYPNDPIRPREAATLRRVYKEVTATAQQPNRQSPHPACEIDVAFPDGDYMSEIRINFNATSYGVFASFYGQKELHHVSSYATSARVEGIGAVAGSFIQHMSGPFRLPNGELIKPSQWFLSHGPYGAAALGAIVAKLRHSNFQFHLGYWLDNLEVVYVSTSPLDPGIIDQFEACATEVLP